ncbi:hypothetical protein [Synechocystis salina]|uniref:Uncharacterized protein n=1 Tax=Synechocystis salina LEGE 00031 TaxID=1828736 RepID=A0ABR9VW50_9SYNC|nr:hypothetical protein [Synechocystis salina]MBE9242524.1 hypothetical protein [Synechocystis salina LEGE 00041]MBE9255586.1 hypothetical protein [Synechocystis salina LEGE 00031]
MQLIGATVSKAPRQVKTKYGDRLVCDVRLEDGTESAIWGPVGYAPLEYLERGQAVTVSRDSKGKISIIENHLTHPHLSTPALPQPSQVTATTPQGMTAETKKAIAQYVQEQRDLLAFCLDQAGTIPQAQTDESVEKLGVTLYLSAQRKFKLA